MKPSIFLLGVLAAAAVAAPAPSNYVLHEQRAIFPASWSEGKRVHGKTSLPMRIGLAQSNLEWGRGLLMEV